MTQQLRLETDLVTHFVEACQELVVPKSYQEGIELLRGRGLELRDEGKWAVYEFPQFAPYGGAGVNQLDGELTTFGMDLGVDGNDPHTEPNPFLDDVYAETATLVTGMVGKPSKRTRGEIPKIQWKLPNGGRLSLERSWQVHIEMETPRMIRLDGVRW